MNFSRFFQIAVITTILLSSYSRVLAEDVDVIANAQTAANAVSAAQADAAANIPATGASRNAENALDAAIRNASDAADANASVQNSNASQAQKNAAQKRQDTADAAVNTARARADQANANGVTADPSIAERFRAALERRREAVKDLKKAIDDLRREMGAARRNNPNLDRVAELERALQRAQRALGDGQSPVAMVNSNNNGTALAALTAANKVKIEIGGTGETIGHVADLKLTNITGDKITVAVPPMVLVCGNGKSQDYATPFGQTVTVAAGKTQTVPLTGVCIARTKPPVAKGVDGELFAQDGDGNKLSTTKDESGASKISKASTANVLQEVASCFKAAEALQAEGAYAQMPYSDPKMQKEIATQWSVWCNPQVAQATGTKVATKSDLAKTVYKQAEQGGALTTEKKKQLDTGINALFQSIELTGKKAKELKDEVAH
jgi:hypothetical protein